MFILLSPLYSSSQYSPFYLHISSSSWLVLFSLFKIYFNISFQEQKLQEETEIDKQEREIIESLEREEKEHKKYLSSVSPSGRF